MRLKNFFLSILAGAALAAGCAQEQVISSIPEFKVDQSYLGIPLAGGITSAGFTATAPWSFDVESVPDWLTISPMSGSAGSDHIVFAADANPGSSERTANLLVSVAGQKQRFTVIQEGPGAVEAPISTIAQVVAGKDGEVFRVRGTVTTIANTNYGNLYIEDETGSIYIYGLFNAKGQYPKDAGGWNTFGVEAGDVITVQGPRTLYNGTTLELVDATLIKVEKSLIEIDPSEVALESADAGTFTLSVVSKANGMAVLPSADWVKVTDIAAGEGDAAVYTFAYEANTTTAARTATIQFKATNSSKSVTVSQPGIPPTGQSVTEIVALPDNSGVETLGSVVVAMTTKGFVISDGTTAIYVYDSGANAVELGDAVKVFATKTTYNGVPELATVTSVEKIDVSSWNHPAVKDITAEALTYEASVAEYIQFKGTLKVSGNYYNVEIDGVDSSVRQGSIVYPVEALGAAAFDGQSIIVSGYFNGLSGGGKYINVIATKIVGADAKGTASNPYSPAEAAAAVAGLSWTSNTEYESTDEVYVKGKICKIANKGTYTEGGTYGNASFYLSADGTGDGEFYVFRALYLGNVKFTEGKTDIKVGDDVVIYGKLMNYQGNTPETVSGKAYLYSLNGKTE
ncbi:MAG: hypothetical protein IJP49_03400 [Bacteroidales bacterium]|nr:hypothetical protein [Bacteroidales bacterium]